MVQDTLIEMHDAILDVRYVVMSISHRHFHISVYHSISLIFWILTCVF
jgi:hypothetical protein